MTTERVQVQKIRVLIVDDHPLTGLGLRAAAAESPDCEIVGDAPSIEGALEHVAALKPDVAVLDIRLGDGANGIELARMLRARFPDLKLLVLSAYSLAPYVRAAHGIGANGYVLKSASASSILDAIRRL